MEEEEERWWPERQKRKREERWSSEREGLRLWPHSHSTLAQTLGSACADPAPRSPVAWHPGLWMKAGCVHVW